MKPFDEFLRELPLFKSFSQGELKSLTEKSQLRTFAPTEAIIHFGQLAALSVTSLETFPELPNTGVKLPLLYLIPLTLQAHKPIHTV